MLAVLQDALDCFQKYAFARDVHGRQLFADAEDWISCEDRGWYYSFENICETLEINPDYLRRGVRDWKKQVAVIGPQEPRIKGPVTDDAVLAVAG